MNIFGMTGWEIILLAFLAVFILGPDRMPEYAAKLARGVRSLRQMADGARGQLKEQLGPEYAEVNWRQYDPRQYDPRRIVRQALIEPLEDAARPLQDRPVKPKSATMSPAAIDPRSWDPERPVPVDLDAT